MCPYSYPQMVYQWGITPDLLKHVLSVCSSVRPERLHIVSKHSLLAEGATDSQCLTVILQPAITATWSHNLTDRSSPKRQRAQVLIFIKKNKNLTDSQTLYCVSRVQQPLRTSCLYSTWGFMMFIPVFNPNLLTSFMLMVPDCCGFLLM